MERMQRAIRLGGKTQFLKFDVTLPVLFLQEKNHIVLSALFQLLQRFVRQQNRCWTLIFFISCFFLHPIAKIQLLHAFM